MGFDAGEDEVAIVVASDAFVREGVVGEGFEEDAGEGAGGDWRFDEVGFFGGDGAAGEVGAVLLAGECGAVGGGDFFWSEGFPGGFVLGEFGFELRFPGGEQGGEIFFLGFDGGFGGGDGGLEVGDLLLLSGIRDLHGGVGVAAGAIGSASNDAAFFDVVEEGEELIKFLLADGIVFVVVAAGAAEGETHPGGAGGVDAVDDVFDAPFLVDDAAFAVDAMVAMEAGGDDLVKAGAGEEVAGELFDGELVEGFVFVEGADDPVAPGPHGAGGVGLEAVAVGVAGVVEPALGHLFAEGRRLQEAVDEGLVGGLADDEGIALAALIDEGFDVFGGGRQAGEVEGEAADEGSGIGLRG